MRLNDNILRMAAAALSAMAMASCTVDVDLCSDPIHPHSAEVAYSFDFGGVEGAPDTMIVVANRVVNRRISAMNVSTATGSGRFIVGELPAVPVAPGQGDGEGETPGGDGEEVTPGGGEDTPDGGEETPGGGETTPGEEGSDVTIGGDEAAAREGEAASGDGGEATPGGGEATPGGEEATPGGEDETPGGEGETPSEGGDAPGSEELPEFRLPVGTYRFLTFNMDSTEYIYTDVEKFLAGSDSVAMGDLYIEYRSYPKNDPDLRGTIPDWQDYNPYAGYIQPDLRPLFVATAGADLAHGQRWQCRFAPRVTSQLVDVYFDITKYEGGTPFIVDSVVAEISGLPYRVNLVNGNLDIRRTNKMMFRMGLVDAGGNPQPDTYAATSATCHASISVPGIVPGSSTDVNTGPGIMQVMIFMHSENPDDPSEPLHKMVQGKINLFNTLREARLTDYTDDMRFVRRTCDHGELDINAPLIIDGDAIQESPDNDGGLDAWRACDDIVVDI